MASFVGQHLEEMADMRSARKCKVVLLCSVIALVILTYYGSIHIANQNYLFGTLNLLCVAVLSANLWYLRLNQSANFSDLVLSCVLLFQGMMLLLFGEHISDRLLWLYPIMAAVIFVCEFRYGLLFSSSFYVLTMITCLFTDLVSVPLQLSVDRFLISLLALCLLLSLIHI